MLFGNVGESHECLESMFHSKINPFVDLIVCCLLLILVFVFF
jgi:hypothetical protein